MKNHWRCFRFFVFALTVISFAGCKPKVTGQYEHEARFEGVTILFLQGAGGTITQDGRSFLWEKGKFALKIQNGRLEYCGKDQGAVGPRDSITVLSTGQIELIVSESLGAPGNGGASRTVTIPDPEPAALVAPAAPSRD